MIQAVDHVRDPHRSGFEKNRSQILKTIQHAAANERSESHEHGEMKGNHAGRVNVTVEIVDGRTGPADVNGQRKFLLAERLIKREKQRIVQLTISGGAQDHDRHCAEPLCLAYFMRDCINII